MHCPRVLSLQQQSGECGLEIRWPKTLKYLLSGSTGNFKQLPVKRIKGNNVCYSLAQSLQLSKSLKIQHTMAPAQG